MVEHIAGKNVADISTFKVGDILITDGVKNDNVIIFNHGYAILSKDGTSSIELRQKIFDFGVETTVYLSREDIIALYNSIKD